MPFRVCITFTVCTISATPIGSYFLLKVKYNLGVKVENLKAKATEKIMSSSVKRTECYRWQVKTNLQQCKLVEANMCKNVPYRWNSIEINCMRIIIAKKTRKATLRGSKCFSSVPPRLGTRM